MSQTPGSSQRAAPPRPKRSLLSLVTDIPALIQELFHREVELLKAELFAKLKALGVGAGMLAGAGAVLLFMIGVLLTSAVLALSLVLPGWLAALIVAAFLLIVAGILALIGYRILKRGIPPLPTESIDSLQKDYRAIRGIGKRGTS
ncbi:MAG TPA: phage holin family protein [Pseudolysinimonas sp.]|nr:phage holin family protein [Pseudolysinimonas sp.]